MAKRLMPSTALPNPVFIPDFIPSTEPPFTFPSMSEKPYPKAGDKPDKPHQTAVVIVD
jgi:hypothetical protein